MASFRKRNGKWQARIQRKHLPSVSQSFYELDIARKWVRKMEREIDLGLLQIRPDKNPLAQLLLRYQNDILPSKRNPQADIYRIKALLRFPISRLCIEDIKSHDIADFRDSLIRASKAPNTIRLYLAILSHLFTVAKTEWGYVLKDNPVLRIRRPKLPPSSTRRLTDNDISLICEHTQSLYLPFAVKLALHTAMRLSEIMNIQWSMVDMHYQTITLLLTKNGEARSIPLSNSAMLLINSLPLDSNILFPITPHAITIAFMRACKRAGIKGASFHTLRHEAISRFFEMGLNPMEVAAISGHKSMQVLKRYTHIKASHLLKKINGVM